GSVRDPHFPIVKSQTTIRFYDPHEQRREIAESGDLFTKRLQARLEPLDRPLRDLEGLRNYFQNGIPVLLRERFADSARNNPRRVNPLATQSLDHLLPELPKSNSVLRQFTIL